MSFLREIPLYIYVTAGAILFLIYHARQAKLRYRKLMGSGRVNELVKWENRKELCYFAISALFIVDAFLGILY